MNIKYLILSIVILVVIIVAFNFIPRENITIENEVETTLDQTVSELSAKSYDIIYNYDGGSEKYFIQEAIFKDSDSARKFTETFIEDLSNYTTNRESLTIGDFEGYSFVTLSLESKESGFGLLIRKGDSMIYGSGIDKNNLIKVTEWFINRY